MRKLSIIALCALVLTSVFAFSLSAERTLPLVVDNASLMTSEETASLNEKLEGLSDELQFELAVVTVNSTNGKDIIAYADDFYDQNGYGYGENDDGALLLIDMGERMWYITTNGTGETLLDYDTLGYVESAFSASLSSGDFYEAFTVFADECEYYILNPIDNTQGGNSGYYDDDYDYDYDYDEVDGEWSFTEFILPSLIIGFVIALIMVSVMKSGMKTVKPAKNAASYMVDESLKLNVSRDTYLYRTVTRTRKAEHHSSGGGGGRGGFGGGSHMSSSGRSHGGRGGRF